MNCEVINGVEAYPYPSVCPISPLNTILADCVININSDPTDKPLYPVTSEPSVLVATDAVPLPKLVLIFTALPASLAVIVTTLVATEAVK